MNVSIKLKNTLFIIVGSAFFAFGLINFNIKNKLAEGGITGITLILYNLFHIDPAISNIVINIPLFLLSWKYLGKSGFIYTLIGTVGLSFFLYVFQHFLPFNIPLSGDMTLAALFAGVSIGSGLGIIFKYGGTTGGSDIVARILFKYIGWNIGKTMFLIDALVITASLIYLNFVQAMYTLVAVFVASRVIDFIQKGAYAAKAAMIISQKNDEISKVIIKNLDRSVTILNGKGGYTGQQMGVLYCVVSQSEIFRLKNLVNQIDPHAFVSIHDVYEVFGEGFTLDSDKKPIN
ncbi:DUF2179 domain-containing protein [Terrilactibacillus sp. BCM23-1]|uniref:DUF2179 domain-containing protein n=1 Tax=Terrilactibacillus tamarindi TaxID=2599694 RepID=A0A6N8CUB4_9BACI|nr:YitT family protein [Terrilactibacillus tamarindi]MTT32635.1 DUF2179 domain-containing protein [Terrilactibacillus tamarindi]